MKLSATTLTTIAAAIAFTFTSTATFARGSEHHSKAPSASSHSLSASNATANSRMSNFAPVTVVNQDSPYHAYEWQGRYEAKIRNTPSVDALPPAPTISCYKTAGLSVNVAGFGGGLGAGTVDKNCEMREVIRLGQSDNDPRVRAAASNLLLIQLHSYAPREATEAEFQDSSPYSTFEQLSSLN